MERRRAFIILLSCILVYTLCISISSSTTKAWFMSETESHGKVVNATTKDLLDIDADLLSFDAACVTNIEIKIKNIADVEIPIKLDEKKLQLSPGELFSEVVTRKVSCEAEQVNFHLIGFNSFIDEIIIVSFDPPPT